MLISQSYDQFASRKPMFIELLEIWRIDQILYITMDKEGNLTATLIINVQLFCVGKFLKS